MEDRALRKQFDESGAWGLLTSLDLTGCEAGIIRDGAAIARFVAELCDRIEMRRFGPCHVVHFGEEERVAGYSMFQLIETSCISGHFANMDNSAYLDIFSCKFYSPEEAVRFAKDFFGASRAAYTITFRGGSQGWMARNDI